MDPTALGHNRTGMQMAPMLAQELTEATSRTVPSSEGGPESLSALRSSYIIDAEPLGSVPPPGSVKGVAQAGLDLLTGKRLHAFVDKVAERLAFERGGTRLYDALMEKAGIRSDEADQIDLGLLRRFRDHEAAHFAMLADCLRTLGADPTAQTPCADLVGVQSAGLLASVLEPRTSIAQTLSSVLAAELIDGAGWDLLIHLARETGHDEMVDRFDEARREESEHLDTIRTWYVEATLAGSRLAAIA